MSSTKVPLPNHNFVPEYQQSGIPFVTGSSNLDDEDIHHIQLPTVSRWFVVHSTGNGNNQIRVGFTENGVKGTSEGQETNNYYVVHTGEQTSKLELKVKDIYIANFSGADNLSYSLIAGLTGVPRNSFPTLTGSLEENGVKVLTGVG